MEQSGEMVVVLDRIEWNRGKDKDVRLLSELDGSKCCLGYLMAQAGTPVSVLSGYGEPAEALGAAGNMSGCPQYLVSMCPGCDLDGYESDIYRDTLLTTEAISINDDTETDDEQKLSGLNQTFKPVGVSFVLVDTPEQRAAMGGLPVDFARDVLK